MQTIFLFIGESACGKNYTLDLFLSQNPDIKRMVSVTTRPMRDGEIEGKDYNFISDAQFDDMIKNDELIEYREYHTEFGLWRYGTPKLSDGDYAGIVDISGAKKIVETYPDKCIRVIYIKVNEITRTERAKKRGSFDKDEWERRLETDRKDFSRENLEELNMFLIDHLQFPLMTMK